MDDDDDRDQRPVRARAPRRARPTAARSRRSAGRTLVRLSLAPGYYEWASVPDLERQLTRLAKLLFVARMRAYYAARSQDFQQVFTREPAPTTPRTRSTCAPGLELVVEGQAAGGAVRHQRGRHGLLDGAPRPRPPATHGRARLLRGRLPRGDPAGGVAVRTGARAQARGLRQAGEKALHRARGRPPRGGRPVGVRGAGRGRRRGRRTRARVDGGHRRLRLRAHPDRPDRPGPRRADDRRGRPRPGGGRRDPRAAGRRQLGPGARRARPVRRGWRAGRPDRWRAAARRARAGRRRHDRQPRRPLSRRGRQGHRRLRPRHRVGGRRRARRTRSGR